MQCLFGHVFGLLLFIQTESRGDIRGAYRAGHQGTHYITDTKAAHHGDVRKIAEHLQNHQDEEEYDNEYIEPGNYVLIVKLIKSVLFTYQVCRPHLALIEVASPDRT